MKFRYKNTPHRPSFYVTRVVSSGMCKGLANLSPRKDATGKPLICQESIQHINVNILLNSVKGFQFLTNSLNDFIPSGFSHHTRRGVIRGRCNSC